MSTGTGTILGVLRAGAATVCRQCSLGKKEVVRRQWSLPCNRSSFSSVAVYAIGEGWTGALGTGRLDQCIAGHADDRHPLEEADEFPEMPVCMYESNRHEIISCAAGWGHTAFITRERVHHHHQPYQNQQQYPHLSPNTTRTSLPQQQQTDIDTVPTNERQAMATSGADNTFIQPLPADASQSMNMMIPATNNNNTNQLHVTGRPHEFSSLMRLHRLPRRLRQYAVQQTFQSVGGGKDGDHNTASSWMNPVNWVGRAVTFLSDAFHSNSNPDWEIAREHSFLTVPTVVDLTMNHKTNHDNSYNSRQSEEEDDDFSPVQVACSAGLTAVTTASGAVLTFGLNGMGQCGIGQTSNNVWTPSRVTGLSREFAASNRIDLPQSHPIQHTALGLQHGLCFNTEGELFAWGKGERGQLGIETVESESYTATPLYKAVSWNQINNANPSFNHSSSSLQTDVLEPPKYYALGKISQVSAGMIHSAALDEESNIVYVWGKNTAPIRSDSTNDKGKVASDARVPFRMTGLPENRKVLQISCGSHHTSVLLDDGSVWAVGLATDTKQPIHTPVCLIVPGVIDLATLTQFAAHMDRTTVVFAGGLQVLQAHLWHDMESQSIAVFTPAWVDNLLESDSTLRIREIHRSWLHTVIVAEKGQ